MDEGQWEGGGQRETRTETGQGRPGPGPGPGPGRDRDRAGQRQDRDRDRGTENSGWGLCSIINQAIKMEASLFYWEPPNPDYINALRS